MIGRQSGATCAPLLRQDRRARWVDRTLTIGFFCLTAVALEACAGRQHPASVPAAGAGLQTRVVQGDSQLELVGEEEFVVRVVSSGTTCSGTLIAEDLVLTAHHCVSVHDGSGNIVAADMSPAQLSVEVGSGHFPMAEVGVSAILSPTCGYAAGAGDIAVLVLSKRLHGVRTLQPALDREPLAGDQVSHVGFGRCALSDDGIYLKHRNAGTVDFVSETAFRVNVPLCPGDSGGPVILHQSGELVGVVSAGAMDADESSADRVEFARLDYFRGLFSNAARMTLGTPLSELPPIECPQP